MRLEHSVTKQRPDCGKSGFSDQTYRCSVEWLSPLWSRTIISPGPTTSAQWGPCTSSAAMSVVMTAEPKNAGSSTYATRVPVSTEAGNRAGDSDGDMPASCCRKPWPSRQTSTVVCELSAAAAALSQRAGVNRESS